MPTNFGQCLSVVNDWPLNFVYATGYRNVALNLFRRLQTPRGSLPWDLDCGWDVRQLFRGSFTAAEISRARAQPLVDVMQERRRLMQLATQSGLTLAPLGSP